MSVSTFVLRGKCGKYYVLCIKLLREKGNNEPLIHNTYPLILDRIVIFAPIVSLIHMPYQEPLPGLALLCDAHITDDVARVSDEHGLVTEVTRFQNIAWCIEVRYDEKTFLQRASDIYR